MKKTKPEKVKTIVTNYPVSTEYVESDPNNCPVKERTLDGFYIGVCAFYLKKGITCPQHGQIYREE